MAPADACDCDVVIIGAGPAGLSTALYAGAEECSVRLLDAGARPGGQAGQSTKIRNLYGFPEGISGPDLAALGADGALSFGVNYRAPVRVHQVRKRGARFHIDTDTDSFTARSVVLATGSTPRAHSAEGLAAYVGRGVSYRGPDSETPELYNGVVWIIGGGNSAGQAAVFLAGLGCDVHIVVRGAGLAASMSRYLISAIERAPNIELHAQTVVQRVKPTGRRLGRVHICDGNGIRGDVPVDHLFVMIGSDPNTRWLRGYVALSDKGYVCTGADIPAVGAWIEREGRAPYAHETTVPGIFAAGEVRYGALPRVAASIGEGAGAYNDVHRYLNG